MEEIKKPKKKLKITIFIVSVLTLVISLSYAFLALLESPGASTNITVGNDEVESLKFTKGDDIALSVNLFNFGEGDGSLSSVTTSSATLTAGEEAATKNYQVYFLIKENTYNYTHNESTPELVLTVTDPSGNIITNIDDLNPITVTDSLTGEDITGFDATTHTGLIKIKEDQVISTTSSTTGTTQNWNIKLTYINLPTSQNDNAESVFDAELILQEEKKVMFNEYLLANHTQADGLIQHTSSIATSAQDNNYRYSGTNPNNWVCFGSDETTCPEANKYRILGIYNIGGENKVKLIKETAAITNQAFDGGDDNRWEGADPASATDDADINIYLNNTFYNAIPSNYQSVISTEKLNIGSIPYDITYKPYNFYEKEVLAQTVQSYNIGLMYPSDYFYGASESYWGLLNCQNYSGSGEYCSNTEMKDNNWVSLGYNEWTVVPTSSSSSGAWIVYSFGIGFAPFSSYVSVVRPTMYLKTNVEIISGMGSEADPFRLGM